MTGTGGLADFIGERYDEAEARARAAARKRKPPWRAISSADGIVGYVNNSPEGAGGSVFDGGHVADAINGAVAEYIAGTDPAWRLTDIALKRAALADLARICEVGNDLGAFRLAWRTMRQLGVEFSGHPGYKAEWAPGA